VGVAVAKLVTRCRVPRRLEAVARLADRIARQRLATELTQVVGPALSRQTAVVRIRRLNVKVQLTSGQFGEDALVGAWTRALAQALFEALARPDGSGPDPIVRVGSMAEFRAAFLRDLMAGKAAGRWEYAEFADCLRLPVAEAAVSLLLSDPPDIVATLVALADSPALDNLLALLDDLALERLFAALAGAAGVDARATPGLEDLLWVARRFLDLPAGPGLAFDSRRCALRMFVETKGGEGRSPRTIYHSLLTVTCLLEWPLLLLPEVDALATTAEIEQRLGRRLPPAVLALLVRLRREATSGQFDSASGRLGEALDRLHPFVLTVAPAAVAEVSAWREVDAAGLLLLVAIVRHLGWDDLRADVLLAPWGGPRFFQALLAGIGAAVLRPLRPLALSLDPAVALFAGIEHEPAMTGLLQTLAPIDATGRRILLDRLAPGNEAAAAASDWAATFDALAALLIGEFATRIRGFREASRGAIVRQFLLTPGRVRWGERVVSVLLEPSPFHVALRISVMDDPLSSVSWMGGRRLEFGLLGT
jgi:hypothetical protein